MPSASSSQDFWCSLSTFWAVRKALPRWTRCPQGVRGSPAKVQSHVHCVGASSGRGSRTVPRVLPEPRTEWVRAGRAAVARHQWPLARGPGDALQLCSGLPCSSLLFRLQPSLARVPSCRSSWHLLLPELPGRLGLGEGVSQGLVEAEEGRVSLVLRLSDALAFGSLLKARDQPAVV